MFEAEVEKLKLKSSIFQFKSTYVGTEFQR